MKKALHIIEELVDLGIDLPSVSIEDRQVPEDYFTHFASSVIEQIRQEEFLNSIPKEMPYTVPDGYFEKFQSETILDIQTDTFLAQLPKEIPYQVPSGYFINLESKVLSSIQAQESKFAITTSKSIFQKLALAATLLLLVSISFKGLMLDSRNNSSQRLEHKLASVSDLEIDQYMDNHQIEVESSLALQSIDDNKIDINTLENEVLDNTLHGISDEEILNYSF